MKRVEVRVLLVAFGPALVSCGGGGSSSSAPTLSTLQTTYVSVALATNGGVHDVLWNIPASGAPTSAAGDFIVDISSGGLAKSPLTNGAQAETAAWTSLSVALAVPTLPINISVPSGAPLTVPTSGPTVRLPNLVVKNGGIISASSAPSALQQVSYVGNNVQVDTFALDGTTVAYSTTTTALSVVPVAGQSVAAPTDTTIAAWLKRHNLVANAPLLKSTSTFATGSSYVLFTATRNGDTMFVGDCTQALTSVSGSTLVPCQPDRQDARRCKPNLGEQLLRRFRRRVEDVSTRQ